MILALTDLALSDFFVLLLDIEGLDFMA